MGTISNLSTTWDEKFFTLTLIKASYRASHFLITPNVTAAWLALLVCIQVVSGSNVSPQTSYPD
jgi:hypothetical protein